MNTVYYMLIFYYIFSFIVVESRLLYVIINDRDLNTAERWIYFIVITIIVFTTAPISLPIAIGRILYQILDS